MFFLQILTTFFCRLSECHYLCKEEFIVIVTSDMKKTSLLLLTALLSGLLIPLQAQKLEYAHTVELVGLLPTGSFSKSIDLNPGYPILERNQIGKDAALGVGLDYRFGVKFDIVFSGTVSVETTAMRSTTSAARIPVTRISR